MWTNSWNAENRLITITSRTSVPSAARAQETWTYLADGRWIERIVGAWNGSAYTNAFTNRFVWDGQVLLAVLDHTNGLVMSFLRGLDLSGTLQDAGGVGGVLAVTFKTNGTHFFCYDGNGNVTALVSATNGAVTAEYEHSPFGQTLRATGPAASANPIRFSTQYADDVVGQNKWLYREEPSPGRWLSRDPIGERGGPNIYGFIRNNPENRIDYLGLRDCPAWAEYMCEHPSDWRCPKKCNGIAFDPRTQCCCNQRILSKALKPTGVKTCSAPATSIGLVIHLWLELDDGTSIDMVAGGSPLGSPARISSPTEYADREDKHCQEVMLSECEYDINKFKAEVKRQIRYVLELTDPETQLHEIGRAHV